MAFPSSGLFVATMVDVFDTTQLAIDLDLETHKLALFTNSITADLTADTAFGVAPWNANEVSGTGYTAGGAVITGTTWTHSSGGVIEFDSSAVSWTTATFSSVRGGLIYADALAGNNGIAAINFGADYAVTAGTLQVSPASAGWWNWDVLP